MERAAPRGRYDRSITPSQRAQEQRDLIWSAVLELLSVAPTTSPNLTVAEIREATGLARNTFYSHFEGPQAAVSIVVDESADRLISECSRGQLSLTPLDAVRSLADTWTQAVAENPETARVALRWATPRLAEELRRQLSAVISQGIAAGAFSRDPTQSRSVLLTHAALAALNQVSEHPAKAAELAQLLGDLIIRACR